MFSMTIGLGSMYYTFLESLALMLEVKTNFWHVDSRQGEQEVLEVSKRYKSLYMSTFWAFLSLLTPKKWIKKIKSISNISLYS